MKQKIVVLLTTELTNAKTNKTVKGIRPIRVSGELYFPFNKIGVLAGYEVFEWRNLLKSQVPKAKLYKTPSSMRGELYITPNDLYEFRRALPDDISVVVSQAMSYLTQKVNEYSSSTETYPIVTYYADSEDGETKTIEPTLTDLKEITESLLPIFGVLKRIENKVTTMNKVVHDLRNRQDDFHDMQKKLKVGIYDIMKKIDNSDVLIEIIHDDVKDLFEMTEEEELKNPYVNDEERRRVEIFNDDDSPRIFNINGELAPEPEITPECVAKVLDLLNLKITN